MENLALSSLMNGQNPAGSLIANSVMDFMTKENPTLVMRTIGSMNTGAGGLSPISQEIFKQSPSATGNMPTSESQNGQAFSVGNNQNALQKYGSLFKELTKKDDTNTQKVKPLEFNPQTIQPTYLPTQQNTNNFQGSMLGKKRKTWMDFL